MQGKSRVRATEEPTFLKAVEEDFLNEAACKSLDKILAGSLMAMTHKML